jgi:hypothetical protein
LPVPKKKTKTAAKEVPADPEKDEELSSEEQKLARIAQGIESYNQAAGKQPKAGDTA